MHKAIRRRLSSPSRLGRLRRPLLDNGLLKSPHEHPDHDKRVLGDCAHFEECGEHKAEWEKCQEMLWALGNARYRERIRYGARRLPTPVVPPSPSLERPIPPSFTPI